MENQGATVVISHQVQNKKLAEYEAWLEQIVTICRNSTGNIDWQIIRPIPDLTFTYTFIVRFDTTENLKKWMDSDTRENLIQKAKPLLVNDDSYYIKSGLDFLFAAEPEKQKTPLRWKQFLLTWSAIFPLSIVIPLLVLPLLQRSGVTDNRILNSFVISGIIVFIMVYLLMPPYTKLVKKWLFN